MNDFVKERDAAFIDFVKTGDSKKVKAYCRKYGVPVPRDYKVFAAGIYKAVQACNSIPEDVKALAMWKCVAENMTLKEATDIAGAAARKWKDWR